MSILKNKQHEEFANLMSEGCHSWRTILDKCGYKPNQAQYCQLKRHPKILKRIAEIQEQSVSDAVMSLTQRMELLTKWIRDASQPKGFRLQCIRELAEQDGSKIHNYSVDSKMENVIRYVDLELPKKQGQNRDNTDQNELENESVLDGLEKYLMGQNEENDNINSKECQDNSKENIDEDLDELFGD